MKNSRNYIIRTSALLLFSAWILSSCSLRKNITAGNFTLWHHHSSDKKKIEFPKQEFLISQNSSVDREFTLAQMFSEKKVSDVKKAADRKTNIKSTHSKTNIKKEDITIFSVADPKKPAPTGKYKFTISQVNTMAIVSFLLIPVMILGFFIPGSLGAAIALTALILGVGLAIFSLAIGAKRRGVWAPGIAAGFWLVILIYLSLLIFVL